MIFMLASCNEEKKPEKTTQPVTTRVHVTTREKIAKAVKNGEMTGAMYKLGAAQALIENENVDGEQTDEEGHVLYLDEWFDTYYTYLNLGRYTYIFESPEMSRGVSIIVSMDKAFGFEANVHTSDDVAYNLGIPDIIDVPANADLFFLVSIPDEILRYTYQFDTKRVDFLFDGEGALMATVLTDLNVYTKFGQTRTGSQMFAEGETTTTQVYE